MPTDTKIRGYEGQLYYTVGSGTKTLYANVTDIELDIKADEIDFSDHSTQGWKDTAPGLKAFSGTIKAMSKSLGTDEDAFFDAIVNSTDLTLEFRPQDVTAGRSYTGTIGITDYKAGAPNSGAQVVDISFVGRGALTRGTITTGGA